MLAQIGTIFGGGFGVKEVASILENSTHYVGCALAYNHLVSGNESNHGVWVLLNELYEFSINDYGVSVEPSEFNHREPAFP